MSKKNVSTVRNIVNVRYIGTLLYRKYIKRLLDIVLSLAGIIVLSPVMLATALLVRIMLGSPVIFKQKRPGKNEKIFEMYKFRSMTDEKDENGNFFSDEVRLTGFGKKLRASSLDELPELFNILKGDMSVVGPRPLLVEYLPKYSISQKHRHDVRPGLTGLAQVKGRNSLSWEQRFEWDIEYVKNISFRLDLFILIQTIQVVLKRKGIHSDTSETMEDFKVTGEETHKCRRHIM